MSQDLLADIKTTLRETLIREGSNLLEESAGDIAQAIDRLMPILLSAFLKKSLLSSDPVGYLTGLLADSKHPETEVINLMNLRPESTAGLMAHGHELLSQLLEDQYQMTVDYIAGSCGLKSSSAAGLLQLSAPLVATEVLNLVKDANLDRHESLAFFKDQMSELVNELPEFAQPYTEPIPLLTPVIQTLEQSPFMDASEQHSVTASRLWPWIALLIASLVIFFLIENGSDTTRNSTDQQEEQREEPVPIPPASVDTLPESN